MLVVLQCCCMSKFHLRGGRKLRGEFRVSGMKNAATPLIAASLLSSTPVTLRNVPAIIDVERMLSLLRGLGVHVSRDESSVTIDPQHLNSDRLDQTLVKRLRSSVLLLGPLCAKTEKVTLPTPGGCYIGTRPIDTHITGLRQLGVAVSGSSDNEYTFSKKHTPSTQVILPEFSVTATENVLMYAATLPQTTKLYMAAAEPHVQNLCYFLQRAGAKITGVGSHELIITGNENLAISEWDIIPDQIEIGTIAVAAAITQGDVDIFPVVPEHLYSIISKLQEIGVDVNVKDGHLLVKGASKYKNFRLQALPHPGFPTDLQAPMAVLATQAYGLSMIHDPLYDARFSYIQELTRMGAQAVICDPHRVLLSGKTQLKAERIKSFDLRAGATLILAGLIAEGETIIEDAEMVDRGYESLETRLSALGADMVRKQDDE